MMRAGLEATAVRRVYGTEVEYGFSGVKRLNTLNMHRILNRVLPNYINVDEFLGNGARLYADIGEHPEYATPECLTIEEAVEHELAGEQIVTAIANFFKTPGSHTPPIRLNKRNTDGKRDQRHRLVAWGSHENYLTWRDRMPADKYVPAFAAHLATRSVFTGSGGIVENRFVVAQKMQVINAYTSEMAHSDTRPLVDLKDDPLAKRTVYRRIQVSCGDANISPWALAMKLGTTSLVMRLIEHDVDLSDLSLAKPLKTAHRCANDITASQPVVELETGKHMRALELQQQLAERALALSEKVELPAEEQEVIAEWLDINDTISKDVLFACDKIDWVARYHLIEAVVAKLSFKSKKDKRDRMAATDLQYDALTGRGQFGKSLRARGAFAWSPSPQAIDRAMYNPPSTPRACFRAQLIERAHIGNQAATIANDWQTMTLGNEKFKLGSPFRKK